jgi:hypothetical protein
MLIALLAVLGLDLIVLVAFVAVLITRKRWSSANPAPFAASSGSPAERSTAFAALIWGTGRNSVASAPPVNFTHLG